MGEEFTVILVMSVRAFPHSSFFKITAEEHIVEWNTTDACTRQRLQAVAVIDMGDISYPLTLDFERGNRWQRLELA